jgi:hypothetical protein
MSKLHKMKKLKADTVSKDEQSFGSRHRQLTIQ